MRFRTGLLMTLILAFAVLAIADKKNKKVLPELVLKAHFVAVQIHPDLREPMSDPNANMKARQDVEKALMKWGRFELTEDVEVADLVITVQRGSGKVAEGTVGGGPVDSRPVVLEGTDNSIRVGAHQGTPPAATQDPGPDTRHTGEGVQVGMAQDTMKVYQAGGIKYPLDNAPIWNYSGKDGLKAPDMKAVEEFRKAVTEAEKAAQQKQQQKQQGGQGQQQPAGGTNKPSGSSFMEGQLVLTR